MPYVIADLVQETSTGTGASSMVLAGAVRWHRPFGDVMADGDTTEVLIRHASANEFQICDATYVEATNALTIGTVRASSNAGAAVSFSAGVKTISLVATAAKAPRTLKQVSLAGSYTGGTSEQILSYVQVKGGQMGRHGALELDQVWRAVGSAGAWTMILRIVAGKVAGTTAGTLLLSKSMIANTKQRFNALLYNADSVSAQELFLGSASANGASPFIATTADVATSSIDTGSDFTVSINAQLANAADTIHLRHLRAHLRPGS